MNKLNVNKILVFLIFSLSLSLSSMAANRGGDQNNGNDLDLVSKGQAGKWSKQAGRGRRGKRVNWMSHDVQHFLQVEYKSILLHQRELTGEEMVAKIMDHVEQRLQVDMSADKKKQALF
jgi:hypothetical protein